jgi:hypothetical protein
LLIEYAVGAIPVNPETILEVVSKTAGIRDQGSGVSEMQVPFITLAELEKSMQKRIESIDISAIAQETIARMQGRV